MYRSILAAVALILLAVSAPVIAEESTHACTVDIGAPFLLVDLGDEGEDGPAIGGCLLVHGLEERSKITDAQPADWSLTLGARDCAFQMDDDGDGGGFETVTLGDVIPAGADLWTKCETGHDLTSQLTLELV